MASHLQNPGERDPEDLIPDFDWTRKVTILLSYDSETDTVVIDRGPLGLTLVQAILTSALEDPVFSDEEEYAEDENE